MRIFFIAPGNNPHTWKCVGWLGTRYPNEVALFPYEEPPSINLEGVKIIEPHIPTFKILSPKSWLAANQIRKEIEAFKPQILHVLWAYGTAWYAEASGFHPWILSPWGSDITIYPNRQGLKGQIQRKLILKALASADRITATSKFLAQEIYKLAGRRADLFPYGVDTSIFNPSAVETPMNFPWNDSAPKGDDSITVGFFKRLEYVYGPDILLEAIALAAEEVPKIRCVIAGDGSLMNSLMRKSEKLGIKNRVAFPGRIKYRDMPRALAAIDIFAMPSRHEALGVAALEASAMEKPVIISAVEGSFEVIQDNLTGFLVQVENPKELAHRIVQLANDPALRASMGKAGRIFVMNNFELENIMRKVELFYKEIAEERTRK